MNGAILAGTRSAGILLHPTSLPSGQLDGDAIRWLDWLAEAGVEVWQMLPIGIPLTELSPYQCASAFAINPGLFPSHSVDESFEWGGTDWRIFSTWYEQNHDWVDDFAQFMELKKYLGGIEWFKWPREYRLREPATLLYFRSSHAEAIYARIREQFECWYHWQQLREAARERGIRLFGDMPIFVAYDSADVWAHPERYLLDSEGNPMVVTGVPPDYFSQEGQRWGNPHYNWAVMRAENFHWWRERLRYHFDCFDLVRIDHFRGLEAAWMIPASSPNAIQGHWEAVPGDRLLDRVQQEMGALPLVAEDLGIITPAVTALRDKYGLPGMAVLQFAFDHYVDNPHKPQNVEENTIYYTGTHDNDTLLGWFTSLPPDQQQWVRTQLIQNKPDTGQSITDLMLETILASQAGLVIVPWQDLLRLGSEARMNTPGTVGGNNWRWRFSWSEVPDTLATEVHQALATYHRLNPHSTVERP